MTHARTAGLLASVFSASFTLGYGGAPSSATQRLAAHLGVTPAAIAASATSESAHPAESTTDVAPADRDHGAESPRLLALRHPEQAFFDDEHDPPRPETSVPAAVCDSGPDRRLCSEGDAGSAADTAWLVGLRAPDLPVHASTRVLRFLRYLTENREGRKLFRAWWKRSGMYRDVVARSLRERGLPQDLEALVFVESGFSPTAVSSEGAVGLWQFMTGTARVYGLAVERDYDERRSIEKSTEAATRYLSELYERFGSWDLALAAYDMGYGRLVQRMQETSTNDYWMLSLMPGALPAEAVAYVPKILAVALLLRNMDRFGFDDAPTDDAPSVTDTEVPGGTPLSLVARAAGTSVERLRLLNPEILTANVPYRSTAVSIHLPARGLARTNAMLPRLLSQWHGEEPQARVDDAFDWGKDELAPTRHPSRVHGLWDDPLASLPKSDDAAEGDAANDDDQSEDGRVLVLCRVEEGETLASIAHRFSIRPSRIVADNRLDPTAKLQKGMLLSLRVPRSALSKLASMLPFDDGRRPPPVRLDPPDSDGAPHLDPSPPDASRLVVPSKRHHDGRGIGRRSMADWADLFARAKP